MPPFWFHPTMVRIKPTQHLWRQKMNSFPSHNGSDQTVDDVFEMLEDFVESLKRGRPSPIPARRGLEVLQVIHAGYASSISGEPVRVR